ncbi:DUF4390 domain-containing protein [Sphaerotilus sp.]|uniref:DUF4390 domain-containing protein n=1 Tax=Sphaerotilus sp. TaxID=2093942 RepID=UPI002ACDBDBC|nr:DUF4390 domain-containing protein [Sphaerotilus sp.]MDZ7855038.1 DUF4390 domain-containing protein [Sphaerotilus sp.]
MQTPAHCLDCPTRRRSVAAVWVALALVLLLAMVPARALDLLRLDAQRSEHGVQLSFETRFDLPPSVEDALQRGVALHFLAEAVLMRSRWYWRDKELARTTRTWRIAYQPLTFSYKVSQGGLSQSYRSLGEALRALQRFNQWRIADPVPAEDGRHYIEFTYRLDTEQLPRPLQIGIGSQPEWTLRVARTLALPD